jgi:hypothetical protein
MNFMQTATPQQTPAPDVAPKVATAFTTTGADGKQQTLPIPRTKQEIRTIQLQREQISDQLENVSSRRSDIAQELAQTASDAARPGLQQRLQLLDQRILQLEGDLARTGQQLAAASPELVASTEQPNRQGTDDNFGGGFAAGSTSAVAVVGVIILVLSRRWKRRAPRRSSQIDADSAQRLERLENGMDAIAIEIERVSEGQRFVTKLLSESLGPASTPQRVGQPVSAQGSDPNQR